MTIAFFSIAAACIGLLLQWRARRLAEVRHRRTMAYGVAFTIDLMAVVLGSGGTIHQAVSAVARQGPEAVRPAFQAVLHRSSTGELLADALLSASIELGPPFQPLIGALVAAERDGAPLSMLLPRLAEDAQQARRWQIETMTKRLPVSLLVPLVVCLLPSVVIGALIPLVIVAVRQFDL